ncbi:MAG TPA: alkaline phosphatase family protein [Ktedonobacteraceae bacterium]|nr:alkaline phosphatase family protein [Ktedonobacteraceae bacterium]
MRSIIFGVDGLTFRIMHPLIERGDLPNFQRLANEGSEAVLESRYPPLTPPAWVSLSTGLKPARHGIYDYWEYEDKAERGTPRIAHVQTQRKAGKAIWNILSEYGKRVLVINVPVTYPPEAVNGIMVSGYLTPGSNVDFTFPTSFKEELFKVVPDYQIDVQFHDTFSVKSREEAQQMIDSVLRMTEHRIELTMHLLKEQPWDFCYVVFVGADRLQHAFWDEINALDSQATEYFRLLDQGLGRILELLEPDDNLFVVSDHGFMGAGRGFDINEYLCSQRLLVPDAAVMQKRNRNRKLSKLKHTLRQAGLLSLARQGKRVLKSSGLLKTAGLQQVHAQGDIYQPLTHIDWSETRAYVASRSCFAGGYADIFLDSESSAESLAELRELLTSLLDPQTGKPLLDALYSTEVFGTGPYAPPEPHLLLLPGDGITFRLGLGNERFWDDVGMENDRSKRCGVHQKDGVLYAYGAGIKQGFKAPNAEIYDVVPTVLHAMGLPLPHEFDGRVFDELFVAPQPQQADRPLEGAGKAAGARSKLKKLLED